LSYLILKVGNETSQYCILSMGLNATLKLPYIAGWTAFLHLFKS